MKQNLILTCILMALAACSGEPEASKASPVSIEGARLTLTEPDKASFLKTASVETNKGSTLRLPGRIVWNEEKTVRIFPQLAGRVQSIAIDVGANVKTAQVLATLSSPDYGQAQADSRKAQADARLATQALERSRELKEAGVIAEKDWQQAQNDAARAQAEAERANSRLAGLGGDGNGSYSLRSPLAGVVVERNLNPGMEFRPEQNATPLFVVTDPANLWVLLDASETDLAKLKKGEAIFIESKQYPGERFKGVIRHVADFVDPTSRTIKVRAEIGNADRRLKGEMFVNGLIELAASQSLRVPASAVFLVGDKRYVFVDEGQGHYLRQQVEAGAEFDGWVDILNGLKAGESVVTEGNLNLQKYFKPVSNAPKRAAQ